MRITLDIPLSLSEITHNIKSSSKIIDDALICAITTNSKEVLPGDLFIALTGEKFNGEDFVSEAKQRGAYVISTNKENADILVADTALSLLEIASLYKTQLSNLKFTIAITGSVGKSTTKNILSTILERDYKICSTNENFNNIIGVSYTVLSAKRNVEILILELGMNHLGEISRLSSAIAPDAAIITNIGTAHIGNLGSRAMIAKAKLEVLDGMRTKRLVVPYEEALLNAHENSFYTYSIENKRASIFADIICLYSDKSIVNLNSESIKLNHLTIDKPGKHIISAVTASFGIIDLLKIDISPICDNTTKIKDNHVRGEYIDLGSFKIYEDCYSASYESYISDFELLSMDKKGRYSCVIGDMLELGAETEKLHRKVGEMAFKYGFKTIYAFGVYSSFVLSGARDAGMNVENIFTNSDITKPEITAKQILENTRCSETVLIKASNRVRANRITNILKDLRINNA